MEACEKLVHDQHLQQQGWAAVVANLEDITRSELRTCCLFKYRLIKNLFLAFLWKQIKKIGMVEISLVLYMWIQYIMMTISKWFVLMWHPRYCAFKYFFYCFYCFFYTYKIRVIIKMIIRKKNFLGLNHMMKLKWTDTRITALQFMIR